MDKFYIDFLRRAEMESFLPTFEKLFSKYPEELAKLGEDYVNSTIDQGITEKAAKALFPEYHPNTVETVLQVAASKPLLNLYLSRGYTEEQFYNSMYDVKNKYEEGLQFNGIEGTHCAGWQRKFFRLELIGVGIFQYELGRIVDMGNGYHNHGVDFNVGDDVLVLHIPSGKKFTKEERLKSYKMAYEFFKDRLINGKFAFYCASWLFYPDYEEIFDKGNVHDFRHEFEMEGKVEQQGFLDAHRVFGNIKNLKVEDYPENTSLQRAFKKRMLENGNGYGYGYGYFVFDGEKILTEN